MRPSTFNSSPYTKKSPVSKFISQAHSSTRRICCCSNASSYSNEFFNDNNTCSVRSFIGTSTSSDTSSSSSNTVYFPLFRLKSQTHSNTKLSFYTASSCSSGSNRRSLCSSNNSVMQEPEIRVHGSKHSSVDNNEPRKPSCSSIQQYPSTDSHPSFLNTSSMVDISKHNSNHKSDHITRIHPYQLILFVCHNPPFLLKLLI
jgi:mating pheromone-induced death protein 2